MRDMTLPKSLKKTNICTPRPIPHLLSSGRFPLAECLVAHLAGGAAIACNRSKAKIELGLHQI